MKRLLMLAAAAAGIAVLKRMQDTKAERDLWAEATDDVHTIAGQ